MSETFALHVVSLRWKCSWNILRIRAQVKFTNTKDMNLFRLMFYVPVNSYGHILDSQFSYPHFFQGKLDL